LPDDDITCPLCGNKSKKGTAKCAVCGTELHKVRQRKIRERPAGSRPSGELLRKEIPKTELRKAKLSCPFCAVELKGGEGRCPRCGVPLSTAPPPKPRAARAHEELLECPVCRKFAPVGSSKCPNCGVGFEEGFKPPEPPAEEAPPLPGPVTAPSPEPIPEPVRRPALGPEPEPSREVVTAVVPPAYQAGEGLVNGKGAASDRGFVNGTGLVNGTGMTNGTRAEVKLSRAEARDRSLLTRWQFLAVLVALIIIIPTFVYLSFYTPAEALTIDGEFGDWSRVDKFGAYTTSGYSSIDIEEWAVEAQETSLYMYVKVGGSLMASSGVESFFLFVDSDDNPNTGYSVSGIGANYLLQLDGWDGKIMSTALSEYGASSDYDWSSWTYIQALEAGRGEAELEAKALLPAALGSDARFMLVYQVARSSATYPVPRSGGVLIVRQGPGPDIVQALGSVPAASTLQFMTLRFTCEGAEGEVTSVSPYIFGATTSWSFQEFTISPGEQRTVQVLVDASAALPGAMISAYVAKGNVQSSFSEVIVIGDEVRAYVSSPPSEVKIDGAFGDWSGLVTPDSDPAAPANPNVDLSGVAAVNTSSASYFYVGVSGEMCAGSLIPVLITKPTGGGGGVVIPTRVTGEDLLRVYIDSDLSAATGYLYSVPSKTIGADYMVEVKGLYGEVKSKTLLQYSAGSWAQVVGAIPAVAKDTQRLELSVGAPYIGGSSSIDFIVETTDWLHHTDQATALPIGVRAADWASVSTINPEGWYIEDPTSSPQATALSYQRKLFYDGANFWSFYWDGTNTVYRYSTDYGASWSTTSIAFKTAGVNEVSIWYDSANRIVYAVGDTSTASRDVFLQRGVVDPALKTITWAAGDSTLQASLNSMAGKNTFVSKDASGHIWVLSCNMTSATPPVRYDLSAFRGSSPDSLASWTYSGNMLTQDSNQDTIKGVVVPAGSGNSVWVVYAYTGTVAARKYTGIWSAQSDIYVVGGTENPECTINSPPSAVVDANGVIHVIYGNGHQQTGVSKPFIYYVYNSGSAWSVPYRLDEVQNTLGNMYPTISLDASTGSVYAFWVQTDNAATPLTITCKRNVSGTWQSVTLPAQTANPKYYLTSIYSAPADCFICWQWTQNSSAPIQIIFDKIPEFDTVLVPAFLLMVFVVAIAGRSRRRSRL